MKYRMQTDPDGVHYLVGDHATITGADYHEAAVEFWHEIERLRKLIEDAYHEGRSDGIDQRASAKSLWEASDAKYQMENHKGVTPCK